jgi:hypothetical protein
VSPKPEARSIEARLRSALTLDFATLRQGVRMSGEAISARLRDAAAMSNVCLALGAATRDYARNASR